MPLGRGAGGFLLAPAGAGLWLPLPLPLPLPPAGATGLSVGRGGRGCCCCWLLLLLWWWLWLLLGWGPLGRPPLPGTEAGGLPPGPCAGPGFRPAGAGAADAWGAGLLSPRYSGRSPRSRAALSSISRARRSACSICSYTTAGRGCQVGGCGGNDGMKEMGEDCDVRGVTSVNTIKRLHRVPEKGAGWRARGTRAVPW